MRIFEEAEDRTAHIVENAAYFTAIRGAGRARERLEFTSMAAAIASAPGDGRTMIYAVHPDGQAAHVRNV